MPEVRLYNTRTRQIEVVRPQAAAPLNLYCCGPTVYHYAHIGNMRTYLFEDLLARTLRAAGYQLRHVMNITDVGHLQSDADAGDDKMMLAAAREQKSPWDIARYYEDAFFRHADALGIARPDIICRATEHIPQMIAMVEQLVARGHAYVVDGNVYFSVASFPAYADFARLRREEQQATDRVEQDPRKRDQQDFVLWFSESKYPQQIMKWPSPWGVGFPGWHIECSAMASHYLGPQIDIHCGGIDHIPVHHTNEIAQSECCHGQSPWVSLWLHGEFLQVDTGKMSKSKGDTLTVDTLVHDGFDPLDFRYLCLTAHYRSSLRFSYEALSAARNSRATLRNLVQDWRHATRDTAASPDSTALWEQFLTHLCQDLAAPEALAQLWGVARDTTLSPALRLGFLERCEAILQLGLAATARPLSPELAGLLQAREAARAVRDWAEADRLRDALLVAGVRVKDRKDGVDWEYV